MTANIYDSANQIEKEIRQLPEFLALEEAFAKVKEEEATYQLFKEFQAFQQSLQQKQMQGEEFTEEDGNQAQAMAEKVQKSEVINQLMVKEQAFSVILNDLNKIILKPIQDLYNN